MKRPSIRLGIAAQMLSVTTLFILVLVMGMRVVLQDAIIDGSTEILIEVHREAIVALAERIGKTPGKIDAEETSRTLQETMERTDGLVSLFITDGTTIVATTEAEKLGSPLGGGDAAKATEIRQVIADGIDISEVEQRTDIVPRFNYIHPITKNGRVVGAIVAKFSLEKEFHAIAHLREAMLALLTISGLVGAPLLFFVLWILIIHPLRTLKKAAVRLAGGTFDIVLPQPLSTEVADLSGALVGAAASLKAHYERYLSPQVVAVLQKEQGFLRDVRMRTRATILVCDIEGFTNLSEQLDVDDLGAFLSGYFRTMTEIIFAHDGTLDKYMGDGILAVFGAPMPVPEFALKATEAARAMVSAYATAYRDWLPTTGAQVRASRIRIGLSTGEVFYGNVGYERRSDFTALGRAVNLASRLQDLNKETGTSILMDSETLTSMGAHGEKVQTAGSFAVRGFEEPVAVFGW